MSVQRCTTWSALRTVALSGILVAGFAACSDDPDRDETTGEFTESGDADVFSIAVGDCMSETAVGEVEEVPVVPCTEPHDSEVYLSYQITDAAFPGDTGLDSISQQQCGPAFETFVGLPYEQSVLDITTLAPTTASWADGDRELLCMIYDPAGPVTGSLAGAAR